jgi:hypothetical protein
VHEARHRTGASAWWSLPWSLPRSLSRSLPRSLTALAVAGAGLAAAIWLPGGSNAASAGVQHAIFSDEFGADRGTPVDLTKWALDGDADKAVQDGDGHLVTSRLLRTKDTFDQPYGHAEARIKVQRATGPWRAFGLVDEYGRVVTGKIRSQRGGIDPTAGKDFHTYAIDWSPKLVVWSVDGRATLRLNPNDPGLPVALVLNLATDGRSPVRMIVDFVRVSVGFGPGGSASSSPSDGPSDVPSGSPSATPSDSPSPTAPAPTTTAPTSAAPTTAAPTTAAPTTAAPTTTAPTVAPTTTAPKPAAWKPFTNYKAGDLVTYKGVTYRVKEAHTSLPGWEPTALPNLFEKV